MFRSAAEEPASGETLEMQLYKKITSLSQTVCGPAKKKNIHLRVASPGAGEG